MKYILLFILFLAACQDTKELSSGEIIWEKIITLDSDVIPNSLIAHSEGIGFLLALTHNKEENLSEHIINLYDNEGNLHWRKNDIGCWFYSNSYINSWQYLYDTEGSIINEYSLSDDIFLHGPIVIGKNNYIFSTNNTSSVFAYDTNRQLLWEKNISLEFGSGYQMNLILTSQETLLLLGTSIFNGWLIMEMDYEGNNIWHKQRNGDSKYSFTTLAANGCNGTILALANTQDKWQIVEISQNGSIEFLIGEFDKLGGPFEIADFKVDEDCNLIFVGTIENRIREISNVIWVGKFSKNLDPLWNISIKPNLGIDNQGLFLDIDYENNILVSGLLNINFKEGQPTEPLGIWLGKIKQ